MIKKLVLGVYIYISFLLNTFAQDTLFFDNDCRRLTTKHKSDYYTVVVKEPADTNLVTETSYFKNGQIWQVTHYSDYSKFIRGGVSRLWYKSGKLKEDLNYAENVLDGNIKTYWENGNLKRDDLFEKGKLLEGKVFNADGIAEPYYDFEIMPKYPGGLNALSQYLGTHIIYPRKARRKGISGKVILKFVVNESGDIENVEVEKSVSKEIDAEALRVLKKMPKWEPGMHDGKKAKVYYRQPINFKFE